ncbi:MAG: hypothetical protein MI740_10305 [Halanaerobiales bacterium]|nr:hypothetical protein [Halanaerobiales bacterium]
MGRTLEQRIIDLEKNVKEIAKITDGHLKSLDNNVRDLKSKIFNNNDNEGFDPA